MSYGQSPRAQVKSIAGTNHTHKGNGLTCKANTVAINTVYRYGLADVPVLDF